MYDISVTMRLMYIFWHSYLKDIVDFAIISVFIYTLLLFIKHVRSYLVYIGTAICVLLYISANIFNLKFTLVTLEYFARSSVIVFAIIFQNDIRKYIELLGFMSKRHINQTKPSKQVSYIELMQACIKMAQDKMGALIVLQGNYDVTNLLENGIKLDGHISEEIIMSIFDTHSEGHDGALIIAKDKITMFGAHLPLSTNFKEIGKHGTRHTAALGMSENSDALCIVISEEKGTISIAKDGKLKTLKEYADLEKEIDKYVKNVLTIKSDRLLSKIIKHNLVLKVAAIIITLSIWLLNSQ